MDMWRLLVLAGCLVGQAGAVDYASPLVFDPVFYVNIYSDLHIFTTVVAARQHWLTYGIKEGRQGSGNFHSKQYLHRYIDLTRAFGNNYHQAIQHFLTYGQTERRIGYVEGGFEGRYTISNGKDLFLSASDRTAGAVDSLVWDHKEFLNAWDHGRELQMAVNAPPNGDCFNPTEAGGEGDGIGRSTKSKLQGISAHGKVLKTTVHPAFRMRAGSIENSASGGVCGHNAYAINTVDTYGYNFTKTVTIGCAGLASCIKFESGFHIAGHWPNFNFLNFEAPTGYLAGDFTVIKNYNPDYHQIQTHTRNSWPPVFVTPDNKYAMGVWAPDGQETDKPVYYSAYNFGGNFAQRTNKWNVVMSKNPRPNCTSSHVTYVAYICVGSQNLVAGCLRKVIKTFPNVLH